MRVFKDISLKYSVGCLKGFRLCICSLCVIHVWVKVSDPQECLEVRGQPLELGLLQDWSRGPTFSPLYIPGYVSGNLLKSSLSLMG